MPVTYTEVECPSVLHNQWTHHGSDVSSWMFFPKEIILSKSLISRLSYLDVWFKWNIDDLSLFDRWLKTH